MGATPARPDQGDPAQQWQQRLATARATAEAAEGMVRVEVDASGEVHDLVIEPRGMRLPSADLAEEIRRALAEARAAARALLAEQPAAAPVPDLNDVQRALAEISMDAQRRLGEFAAAADQLSRRLDRL